MIHLARNHIARLQTAILHKYTARSVARWVVENTKYAGLPYSYRDHEYQERILSDDSRLTVVRKCSQVGLSEVSARKALAIVNILSPYTVIYTLQSAKFASTFMQTRVQPVIDSSEPLRDALSKSTDNAEVKRFGDSYLWLKGAAIGNTPISIPADHLIQDEVDFCDAEILSLYLSRLNHSQYKRIDRFSTPTLPDYGIDKYFSESRRHFNIAKCNHCGNYFIPDYYSHVKIPDYTKDLREITKHTLTKIRWKEAQLHCPKCGKVPNLGPENREWVCENPGENHEAAGYQVTPFDAPNIVKVSGLVELSTQYERVQDFVNFCLGLPMQDKEATFTKEDFDTVFTCEQLPEGCVNVMGIDVGNTYYFVIYAVDPYGHIIGVHYERVPMGKAKERYRALRLAYQVVCTVIDSGPHAETVMSLQQEDPNLYASVYMKSKSLLTHTVIDKESEPETGTEFVRQVNVNRNRALDSYMEFVRSGQFTARNSQERELVIEHHLSMKRAKVFVGDTGEMEYSWQKTDGHDHYHHANLYAYIAAKIKGVGRSLVHLPVASMMKFRVQH